MPFLSPLLRTRVIANDHAINAGRQARLEAEA